MIFIFSIVLGAENLSYVKYIETHAHAFLPLNISAILGAENLFYVKSIETHARAFLPLNSSAISSVIHTKAARWRAFKLGNAL